MPWSFAGARGFAAMAKSKEMAQVQASFSSVPIYVIGVPIGLAILGIRPYGERLAVITSAIFKEY